MTEAGSPSLMPQATLYGGRTAPASGAEGSFAATSNSASTREWNSSHAAPSICVFDVNETLLDIEHLAPLFQRLFGDGKILREWFGQLILYSNVITLSGPYVDLFVLGQGTLKMLGTIHNVPIGQSDIDELRTRMLTMPAHPDVPAGLRLLKDAGFRLVTLTNSPPDQKTNPLQQAGIDGWFERSHSIDRVRRFKPAPEVYCMVAEALDVSPSAICMVAAHVWDTIGAQSVGCMGALVTRPGNALLPVPGLPQPQVVAPDLPGVASQMIKLWR